MALRSPSMFLYGFQVTKANNAIDFKSIAGPGPTHQATLQEGFYSLTALMTEIKRAMQQVNPTNTYTVTADRTISGGTQNRVTISTSGVFFSLLFGTGPRVISSAAPLIGFAFTDQTGFLTYTGTSSAGTTLTTEYTGYNYLGPEFDHLIYGAVNVSAAGVKEAVVFQIQHFFSVEFKYEPQSKVITQWYPMMDWLIQQRLFEFTPETIAPTVFIEGTLEKDTKDGKGLGYVFKEMLPNFPFNYDTGPMTFRVNVT